jgi:hypothetical protein
MDRHNLVKVLNRLFMQWCNNKIDSSIVKGTIEFANEIALEKSLDKSCQQKAKSKGKGMKADMG